MHSLKLCCNGQTQTPHQVFCYHDECCDTWPCSSTCPDQFTEWCLVDPLMTKVKSMIACFAIRQMHLTFAATKSISSDQTANSSDSTTKQSILISADIWCLLIVEWQRRNTERVVRKQPKTMLTKNTKRTLSYHLNRIFNRCHSTKQSKPIAIASLQKANKQTRK